MNDLPASAEQEVQAGWAPHLQTLHRHFYETSDDQCLLWVNPAQGDPFEGDPLVMERRVRVPISHPNFDVAFGPYLVPLTISKSRDADLFQASVQMAWDAWELDSLSGFNGQAIGGWVQTNVAPKAVARHWATHCHLHIVNGLNKLLRFHDPGVREWLWSAFTPIQRNRLLGPVATVHAFGRNQDLMVHAATQGVDRDTPESASAKLNLTPAQWAQVSDYASVHSGWLQCCIADPEFRQRKAEDASWEREVFRALEHAFSYGIRDVQDRGLFASHALKLGPDFHRHRKLQAVWKKTQAGDFYGAALEEVSGQPVDQIHIYLLSN